MFERIRQMLIKEFIQVFRDPKMKRIIFIVPVIQILVFGYAVTTNVNHVATAVYDLDNTVSSRELVARFENSQYFDIVEYVNSDTRASELIDRGKVLAVIRMNKGFEEDLRAGRSAAVQVLLDGSDSNSAGIVLNYCARIAGEFSQNALREQFKRLRGAAPFPSTVELSTRAWFNENLESRNFYVPGVISLMVMLITLLLTSMAVVREKEIGTMEQVMVTPIRPAEFILGKTVPFALIAFFDVVVITAVGVFWFDVPIRGSLGLLFFSTALYLMPCLGIGLLISTISQTQQQAMLSAFLFFQPAVLLSGFIFPIANMPRVVQWLTFLNPMRYILVIVRGLFLKGVGTSVLWTQMLALGVMGVCTLWLASKRFHKTLE
ncbi:MAG: ABC transporter permease [Acidobacteriia bacterium]|nr:ABC transporter permease [Terriglobia bacterium]